MCGAYTYCTCNTVISNTQKNRAKPKKYTTMNIKTCISIAFLLCCAIPAYAENWNLVTRDKDNAVFVDQESVVRKGDVIEVWTMVDYKQAHSLKNQQYSSGRHFYAFDKRHNTITTISTVLYSDKMGEGAVVGKYDAGDDRTSVSVAPKSIGDRLMKYLFHDSVQFTKNTKQLNRWPLSSTKQYKNLQ